MLINEARKAAKDWCDAWNRRDLDAIMDHYSDEVEFSSPTVIKRWECRWWLRGKAKVRENFAIGVKAPTYVLRLSMFCWASIQFALLTVVKACAGYRPCRT